MTEPRGSATPMPRDVSSYLPRMVVPEGATRYGLVIGIDKYADERLNLRCAVADAQVLRDLMVDAQCGCFPAENVQLLLDREATAERVFRALAQLRRRAAENDVVWIYYAGHAAVEDDAYWVTHDADVDDLFATALGSKRIDSVLSQLRTRNLLLILDCCHAAATALVKNQTRAIVTANDVFGRFQGHGRITLAASDGKQKSVELAEFGHGAFTYFLEKGLRGEADMDNDGVVTADELWSYLRRKVTEASGRVGNPQTPMLSGSMTHDIALTMNAAVTENKQRLMSELERLVGLREHQLTTDEGRFCQEVLLRGARTDAELSLLASLEERVAGQLNQLQFRRFVQATMRSAGLQSQLPAHQAYRPTPHATAVTVLDPPRENAETYAEAVEVAATVPDRNGLDRVEQFLMQNALEADALDIDALEADALEGDALDIDALEGDALEAGARVVRWSDWEPIMGVAEPRRQLTIAGVVWNLLDEIDVLDRHSEDAHSFRIAEAKYTYRARQKLGYPDGTIIEDVGRAHIGGYIEFEVKNLTPGRPIAIVRRIDYLPGDYKLVVMVEGREIGAASCDGADRVARWRNWPLLIPAAHVARDRVRIRLVPIESRDVNTFHVWVYQAATQAAVDPQFGDVQAAMQAETMRALSTVTLSDWNMPIPQPSMLADGMEWSLVDEIDVLDADSEKAHEFVIAEAKDSYRSRQRLKYPDDTSVDDSGRAHVGGYTRFRIRAVPGYPVVLLRRIDYVYGNYELEIRVNGVPVTTVSCEGSDRVHRWRNWPVLIPGKHVVADMQITITPLTADRDVNMFHIWAYQPKH